MADKVHWQVQELAQMKNVIGLAIAFSVFAKAPEPSYDSATLVDINGYRYSGPGACAGQADGGTAPHGSKGIANY